MTKPVNADASVQAGGRHFLRSIMATRLRAQVGEPVRIGLKLKRSAPDDLVARIGGALGRQRYVTFKTAGTHRVPVSVSHADGRSDTAGLDIEVVDTPTPTPYPVLRVVQEPTNPFMLHFGLENAAAVHRSGMAYEWEIRNYGSFPIREPYFVVDCERLLRTDEVIVPFDVRFAAIYPSGERRETAESFRVFNDYAWFKTRGVLKPRVSYDFRARQSGRRVAASCVVFNDEAEPIELVSRQFEVMYEDPDRAFVPGPPQPFQATIEPKTSHEFDCSVARNALPDDSLGFAFHFHGRTRSRLKVEISVYFEHYTYKVQWSTVTHPAAIELLEAAKTAIARDGDAPIALRGASVSRLSIAGIQSFVTAMTPTWTRDEQAKFAVGLDALVREGTSAIGQHVLSGDDDSLFLGKQCLQDEEPPSDNLVCKLTGQRGKVYVPARIMNGKKGDVVLLPGGPLGFIGGLLQKVHPPQVFSHCGIMSANYYKLRHATASDDWLQDEIYGRTFLDPDAVGTEGFSPESVKYIWPGTIDQSVDEAFLGSYFQYTSADGKRQKSYKIQAFSKDPVFFENQDRHIAYPLVVKPDPLLEGDPVFAAVRPTLAAVANKAKAIRGHYRFYCYSDGAISLPDDTAHRAPDRGAAWWASSTRPMVCSTFVLAAINDAMGEAGSPKIRVEGRGMFVTAGDLEMTSPPTPPLDADAQVDELTRDGLYLYDEAERTDAANWLYDAVYRKAYAKSGDLGRFFTDAPDDFANQVVNTFAYDYSGREFDDEDAKDSTKWQEPGVGRTVSPDDILNFWDRPQVASPELVLGLYGSSQRMVYRDSIFEEREIGRWAKREKIGKLVVTVKYQGRPVPGADVKVGGQVPVTNAQGVASVDLPEGGYEVQVGVFMNGLFFDGSSPAQVKDRSETDLTIDLPDPPEFFRVIMIGGHVRIKDEETFGSDEFVDEGVGIRPIYLGPQRKQDSVTWTRKMGGEIRVEARFDLSWQPDMSVDVSLNVKLFEGTSEDTDDLDGERGTVLHVLKDEENVPLNIFVRNDDEDDDDYVDLKLLVSNVVDLS